jgi:hypothetical protein
MTTEREQAMKVFFHAVREAAGRRHDASTEGCRRQSDDDGWRIFRGVGGERVAVRVSLEESAQAAEKSMEECGCPACLESVEALRNMALRHLLHDA